jgi:hypothetical protein
MVKRLIINGAKRSSIYVYKILYAFIISFAIICIHVFILLFYNVDKQDMFNYVCHTELWTIWIIAIVAFFTTILEKKTFILFALLAYDTQMALDGLKKICNTSNVYAIKHNPIYTVKRMFELNYIGKNDMIIVIITSLILLVASVIIFSKTELKKGKN